MISFPAGATMTIRGVVPRRLILVLLIVASSACEVMGCHDEERRALLEIKASMNYHDGMVLQDWGYSTTKVGDDCCQWRGIACDPHTARVVKIDLLGERWTSGKSWRPNLTMLAGFEHLEMLNLALNKMGGSIPEGKWHPPIVTNNWFIYFPFSWNSVMICPHNWKYLTSYLSDSIIS